jgi:hypothetical protein
LPSARNADDRVEPRQAGSRYWIGGHAGAAQRLAHQPAGETRPVSRSIKYEVEIAGGGTGSMNAMDDIGRRMERLAADSERSAKAAAE